MNIFKTVFSLTMIAAVCAAVLATVNAITETQIARIREQAGLNAARAVMPPVKEVARLPGTEHDDFASYVGKNAAGQDVAYAVCGIDEKGYGGRIVLMVGLTPAMQIIGYKKLQASETPGLGMNLTAEKFSKQFKGLSAAETLAVKKDGGKIEAITSATITSRSVCRAINAAAAKLTKLITINK